MLEEQVWALPLSLAAIKGMFLHSQSFFLFLRVLRGFTSPSALLLFLREKIIWHYPDGVSPFGNLRIIDC